ncbi:hypothetical protein VP01_241g3 [Puccinia sorghi]|uniref:Uncharacterized protein n=1 Tax=Puccinia sorghi TaxID=27349 RepID=A0A0L6V8D8_9BASI|nr:hypothetical protein VP01_241g3 [Puccinia sorghi]
MVNFPSESETKSQITEISLKKKRKKTSKSSPPFYQSTFDPSSSQSNINVKGDPEFDDVKNFFSEPYFNKGYVRINSNFLVAWKPDNKPPSTYKVLWCKKEFHVSGSSISNLQTHYDGSVGTPVEFIDPSTVIHFQVALVVSQALVKLEGYQMAARNVQKPLTRVPSFLPFLYSKLNPRQTQNNDQYLITSMKQKFFIEKLSITSYLCGF